jgi:hypothetical protein
MRTNNMLLKLGTAVFAVGLGTVAVAACSSSSNPTPDTSTNDGGGSSSSGSSSSASSSGASSTGSSSGGSSSGGDAGDASTAPVCVADGGAGAHCSSCATVATDPYNTCSQFTIGCIPFDNSVVPTHPAL